MIVTHQCDQQGFSHVAVHVHNYNLLDTDIILQSPIHLNAIHIPPSNRLSTTLCTSGTSCCTLQHAWTQ